MALKTRVSRSAVQKTAVNGRTASMLITIGLVAVVSVAACSSSGHSASPTTTSNTTATTVTTDASHATTTVLGPSGPPADYPAAQPNPPSLAGAYPTGTAVDLVTVMKTLTTYRDWVYSHPNPGFVKNYMFTTGNEYASEVHDLTTLQREGWREDPTPTVIQWARIASSPKPVERNGSPVTVDGHPLFVGGVVTIVEVLMTAPYLNAAGHVVGHEPGGGPVAYSVTLAQEGSGAAGDGQFRILDVVQLNPPGGISGLESQS